MRDRTERCALRRATGPVAGDRGALSGPPHADLRDQDPDAIDLTAAYVRFSCTKRALRCTSTWTRGASPMQRKLWISPALMTRMSPAPASNSSPLTVQRPRPSLTHWTSSYG